MTKGECFKQKYPDFKGEVDFALPQNWIDNVVKVSGLSYDRILGQFVWIYDTKNIFGSACPLTDDAEEIRRKWYMLF